MVLNFFFGWIYSRGSPYCDNILIIGKKQKTVNCTKPNSLLCYAIIHCGNMISMSSQNLFFTGSFEKKKDSKRDDGGD